MSNYFNRLLGLCMSLGLGMGSVVAHADVVSEKEIAAGLIQKAVARRDDFAKSLPKGTKVRFVNVADFDGTLFYGDCTEGRKGEFEGLSTKVIREGLTDIPATDKGVTDFWARYEELWKTNDYGSVLYLPHALTSKSQAKQQALASYVKETFAKDFKKYLFPTSMYYVREFQKAAVDTIVISASPHMFVVGAADVLGVPGADIYGIEVNENGQAKDGILNYREGKLTRLRKIIADATAQGTMIVPIFGMGNDWVSDYPFLEAMVAGKVSPVHALAIMINGLKSDKKPAASSLIEVVQTI